VVRQYEALETERVALEARIVQGQMAVDDLAGRLETRLDGAERQHAEAVRRHDQLKARYADLAARSDVIQALAALAGSDPGGVKVALGPPDEDASDLQAVAAALRTTRGTVPDTDRRNRLELHGTSLLAALAGAAEGLQQDLGAVTRRLQALQHDLDSRGKMLEQAARDGNRPLVEKVHAEEAQARQSLRERLAQQFTVQDEYLRMVAALRTALDAATSRREEPAAGESAARREILEMAHARKRGESPPMDSLARRLQELEKTIRTEPIPVDADRTLLWVDATLNGKPGLPMLVDPGAEDIRLSSRVAAEIGVAPPEPAGDPPADVTVALAGGRTVRARRARLESVQVGPFTATGVDCVVLPGDYGEAPSLLGASFLDRFAARIDAGAGTLALTQVQPKPASRTAKGAASKPAAVPKANRPAPPAVRPPADDGGPPR
jgi:clan AA aspartic protease (TIGR02281 family)